MRFPVGAGRVAVLALAALAAGACSSLTDSAFVQSFDADGLEVRIESGIVFIRMKFVPDAHMQALFEGRVVADGNGCLRLDSEDEHTVVWPFGYGFDAAASAIVNAEGARVGRIGEAFRLGGGEVTSLHDGLGFTATDRSLAEAQCPGRYWIVGTD